MSEYPDDLEGTYTCQVIEPGTEGTAIILTRKEKEEEPEIDVVGTPSEEKTVEYVEPSQSEDWYHTVELLHGSNPTSNIPADEIEKEQMEQIILTRNEEKDRPTKRTNSTRAKETLSELDRLVRQQYEVKKKQQGTPEEAAKCAIMRYVD